MLSVLPPMRIEGTKSYAIDKSVAYQAWLRVKAIDVALTSWAMKKYRWLHRTRVESFRWLGRVRKVSPGLFVYWTPP
jgi:hypothetical protein